MTDPQIAKLTMRCSRRGIKEMDVILGKFAQTELTTLRPEEMTTLEGLLEENDHDILSWVLGRADIPVTYQTLIGKIKIHHNL